MSKVLLVAGMHRSGTSLTAGWLEKCGVWMGSKLIDANPTNPKGHFEDVTISLFQRSILTGSGLDHYLVSPGERIQIQPGHYEQARELLAEQRTDERVSQWGWKDPRTSLLLDFWKEILPDAKFLFVFRPYTHVVDSLSRREAWKAKGRRRKLQHLLRIPQTDPLFARVWQRYNQDVLSFVQRYPQDCLLLATETLLTESLAVIDYCNHVWKFDLQRVDIQQEYEEDLLQTKPLRLRNLYHRLSVPGLQVLLEKLYDCEQDSLRRIRESAQ